MLSQTAFTYDGAGNRLTQTVEGQTTSYTYNNLDQLINDGTQTYTFDADGCRIQQHAAGQITNYLWGEMSPYGDVILETDGSGASIASYVLSGAELISQNRSGITSYYLRDAQGSTRALTDALGTITDTYDYTAFGELYQHTGTTLNNYLYTGQQFDGLTGLCSLRARYEENHRVYKVF